MAPEPAQSTVYFDGSCPLCRAEIGYYSRTDQAGALCFVDVSKRGAETPEGLTQGQAMARFHVRAADGRLLSGAAAFVEVWRRLPRWRWAARVASLPGVLTVLELGYRLFLPARPFISRGVGHIMRRKAPAEGPQRGGA
ncbi:thiol-disulfide oxidoreductase DCC family protein [Bradyrhizobium sp. HKCCYLR20261]|uniref:thiol-disulfide oxidoreductase DCC family protein n=1 Tax=Bradyrhizobium sp. HKCCYLR20261 TaxID=3420760 RepID=UPI003EC14E67